MTGIPLTNVVPLNFGITDHCLFPGGESKRLEVTALKRKAEAPHDDERAVKRREMEVTAAVKPKLHPVERYVTNCQKNMTTAESCSKNHTS